MVIQLTPRTIVFTLFRRWRTFALFFVATLLVTVFVLRFFFWKYESTAIIVPSFTGQDLSDASLQSQDKSQAQPPTSGDLAKLIVGSMADTASSYGVVKSTIQSIGLDKIYPSLTQGSLWFGTPLDSAIAAFESNLDVKPAKESASLLFSFQHPNPVIAQKVLQSLLSHFQLMEAEVEHNPRVALLQKQLDDANTKVQAAEKTMLDYKRQENVSDLDTERKLLLNQRDDYEQNYAQASAQVAGDQSQVDALLQEMNKTPGTIDISNENDQVKTQIDTARAKYNDAQAAYLQAQQTYKDKSPLLADRKQALDLAKQQYEDLTKAPTARDRTGPNPVHETLETQLKQAEASLASSKSVAESWHSRLAEVSARVDHLDAVEGDLDNLQRQLDVATEDYSEYLKRTQEARIQDALNADSATTLTVVQDPDLPYIPKRFTLILLLGLAAAAFGGVGLCLWLEVLDETFGLPHQVQQATGVPVLVTLNAANNGKRTGRWPKRAA